MPFYSILFPSAAQKAQAQNCPWLAFRPRRPRQGEQVVMRGNKMFPVQSNNLTPQVQTPAFFADTGLDGILDSVLTGPDDALYPVYYALAADADTIAYRQEIFRALEDAAVSDLFTSFCRAVEGAVRTMTDGQTVHDTAQADTYAVDGAVAYCDALGALLAGAAGQPIGARGLRAFVQAVRDYTGDPAFRHAEATLRHAKEGIEAVCFSLKIRKGKVIVGQEEAEGDCVRDTRGDWIGADVTEVPPCAIRLFGELAFGPLGILMADALEKQNPAPFRRLHEAAGQTQGIPAPFIRAFTQEIRFYTSWLDTVRGLRERGLPFAYPVPAMHDAVCIRGAYDMELALAQNAAVQSDCCLSAAERGVQITGANHSGKTTYLRAVGQIAALTALGMPAPCAEAELPLFRGLYSHFSDAEEGVAQLGRLKEELVKLKPIVSGAGAGSLVLLNEMFSSTTAQDAQTMAGRILCDLAGRGARVFCVTHTAGALPEKFVSMVTQVAPGSHERLYTVVRAPAETHAYADALITAYHLTYTDIKERITHGV